MKKYCRDSAELQVLYDDALQEGYDTLAEILIEIDRDPVYAQSDPQMARIISDNIKWFLARRRPKEYGDRVDFNVNLTADKEIIAALRASQQRVPLIEHSPMIDITAEERELTLADLL